MKKVLIIAYFFPPRKDIGSQRPYRLAKYFPYYGWDPVILTASLPGPPPSGMNVIESDYQDLTGSLKSILGFDSRKGLHQQMGIEVSKNFNYSSWKSKSIKLVKEIVNYPDDKKGWFKSALESACHFLSANKVDAIISTSSPVTSHLIASRLKYKFKIPWIADFRDPWTLNPYINKHKLIRLFEKKLESKILSDADMIVTVSPRWIRDFKSIHENKTIYCVTNGFDRDDFRLSQSTQTDKFTITYTGQLYNGKRDPLLLFEVLSQLIKEGKVKKELLEMRFYGAKETWLLNEIKKCGMKDVVYLNANIPRQEALKKQKESQILLLLLWNNIKEEGFLPGKLYEYLGARRPIVAYGWSNSVVKDVLSMTNAGRYAESKGQLREIILDYYRSFIDEGEVRYSGNDSIENYSYDSIAKRYSNILNELN